MLSGISSNEQGMAFGIVHSYPKDISRLELLLSGCQASHLSSYQDSFGGLSPTTLENAKAVKCFQYITFSEIQNPRLLTRAGSLWISPEAPLKPVGPSG